MRDCLMGAVLVLSTLAGSGIAHADCADDAATQSELDDCASQSFAKSDRALNGLYREIMQRLGKDSAEGQQLVAAQRAWIAFRDAECAFAASGVEGGSIYPMIVTTCRDTLTQTRIDDLKGYLDCQEGDMSCPVPPQE